MTLGCPVKPGCLNEADGRSHRERLRWVSAVTIVLAASMKPMAEAIGNTPMVATHRRHTRRASMKPMAEAIGNAINLGDTMANTGGLNEADGRSHREPSLTAASESSYLRASMKPMAEAIGNSLTYGMEVPA